MDDELDLDATLRELRNIKELSENPQMQAEQLGTRINLLNEDMQAEIILVPKIDGTLYDEGEIRRLISQAGIKQGIDNQAVSELVDKQPYFEPVIIAKGKPMHDGNDGYFDYQFERRDTTKPSINEDGSVNYFTMNMFEMVRKDQLVARYIPPTNGEFGYTVTGKLMVPKKGRQLARHKGDGFYTNESQTEYFACFDGKIEVKRDEMIISKLYSFKGTVDYTTGNIIFDGDVTVEGDVVGGMTVKAGGNIEIGGHVESATLFAGGDIVIKGGMQGDGGGIIKAGGKVSGRFFENTKIFSKGDISANYLLKCETETEGKIIITGSKGAIIGGEHLALRGIEAGILGNFAFTKTVLKTGIGEKYIERYNELNKQVDKISGELELLNNAIEDFSQDDPNKKYAINEDLYFKIKQAYDLKNSELESKMTERRVMLELLSQIKESTVTGRQKIYEGVTIQIDTAVRQIKDDNIRGTFKRNGAAVELMK